MKKFLPIFAILTGVIFITACGNNLSITVYNAIPLYGVEWAAINGHTEHHDQWFYPLNFAQTSDACDATNSVTFESPEGDTLHVGANGKIYTVDATGNTTLSDFSVSDTTQLLYGGFLDQPHWYAEVNLQSVIIFKK
jgi:hypothetical protein